MASTDTIRTALAADLLAIAGIQQVSTEPKLHTEIAKPGAAITTGGGGTSSPDLLTNRQGRGEQRFIVRLFVNSNTPGRDLDNLMDAARNMIERSASNLANVTATPAVHHATVIDWNDTSTDESVAQKTWIRDLTVQVLYYYSRGSL